MESSEEKKPLNDVPDKLTRLKINQNSINLLRILKAKRKAQMRLNLIRQSKERMN